VDLAVRTVNDGGLRLLLWLWRVLPLPRPVRRAYLAWTHPRFLIGVVALIRDDAGRILMLEHTYRREYPWGLPGGYLQAREDPAQGLAREVQEETGLVVQIDRLLSAGLYASDQLDLLFAATVLSGAPHASPEVRAWRYVSQAELGQILPNQLELLRRANLLDDISPITPP
jgi:8-oxo-dGTP pyrophosphatase MutT (NUDIX family)